MNDQKENRDLDLTWLLGHKLNSGEDTLKFEAERVKPIFEYIKKYEQLPQQLPITIGLFGGWGSGKTTFLAYLTEKLEQDNFVVIYFNAWKYASFMEVFPALVYKILNNIGYNSDSSAAKIAQIGLFLVSKYGEHISTGTKNLVGIDLLNMFQNLKEAIEKTPSKIDGLLKAYYTQVDRVQEQLSELFQERQQSQTQQSQKPMVVLIDELDRCDPREGFEVIKQLRILFTMSEIPIVFVLSANPEPIGLAIKHQYGLNTKSGEYEAKRILEKFVDSYIDMSAPTDLGDYVEALWKNNQTPIDDLYVQKIDKFVKANIKAHKLKNAKVLNSIKTSNPLYSNLRVLRKSLAYISSTNISPLTELQQNDFPRFYWTIWHLEILKQVDNELRHKVSKISKTLGKITRLAYLDLFKVVRKQLEKAYNISSPNDLNESIELKSEKGNTAFSKYKSYFWEHAKKVLDDEQNKTHPQNKEIVNILSNMLADYKTMDFIINLSLFPISDEELQKQESWEKGTILKPFSTYSYLLAAY